VPEALLVLEVIGDLACQYAGQNPMPTGSKLQGSNDVLDEG
jgi:hypothetical protein